MSENPNKQTVQVKSTDRLGRQVVQDIEVTDNDITPIADLRYVTLTRLALPARFEAVVADTVLWVSASGLVSGVLLVLLMMGYTMVVLTLVSALALPVVLWAKWVETHVGKGWKDLTGLRLVMILAGLALVTASGAFGRIPIDTIGRPPVPAPDTTVVKN